VEKTKIPSAAHDVGEGNADTVYEELREVQRVNSELKQTVEVLNNRMIEQGDILREIYEGLALAKADTQRVVKLYDTDDLATRWQVSKRTVENEVAEGNLVPTFIRGARRFTPDAVRAYERAASGLGRRRVRRRSSRKGSSK
jgi:hypothetical protein